MVQLVSPESTMRMLIERLNWPVRMVRWRTAREFGGLLSNKDYSRTAKDVYLNWLSSRQLESEVGSALAVLLCTSHVGLPSFRAVADHITKTSILTDIMLQSIYGPENIKGGWEESHSGDVPPSFQAESYFLEHKMAHVPPIFSDNFKKLEAQSGHPFMRQWAFEWHCLMEETKSPHSGYPYYFVGSLLNRSGVNGQFSQRQSDVYQSAYLRTLACAVNRWNMPVNKATKWASDTLPINRGLAKLDPIKRPSWLSDIPEKCIGTAEALELLVRKLSEPRLGRSNVRPVSLKIPIAADIAEFAELSVLAVLASRDFVPDFDREHSDLICGLPWVLPDGISLEGRVEVEDITTYTIPGITGTGAPLCIDLCPLPFGFWHNDYFQVGIALPAPYIFPSEIDVACQMDNIDIISHGDRVASWSVWHDRWTPLYARDGATRCGTITELREKEINYAKCRYGMALGWFVELKVWKRKTEYGDFELERRREFFFD